MLREDRLVPLIDVIAYSLPHQVITNSEHFEPMRPEHLAKSYAIILVRGGSPDIEVIAPTREFESIITPSSSLLS
tara:strand:- start:514 stop:738 length:225 start_codon:yes stop_codon:yes gene_type:complete